MAVIKSIFLDIKNCSKKAWLVNIEIVIPLQNAGVQRIKNDTEICSFKSQLNCSGTERISRQLSAPAFTVLEQSLNR